MLTVLIIVIILVVHTTIAMKMAEGNNIIEIIFRFFFHGQMKRHWQLIIIFKEHLKCEVHITAAIA